MKIRESRQRNKNHFIVTVFDTYNKHNEILSRYYDGTQTGAIKHFLKIKILQNYINDDRYLVAFRGNSIHLTEKEIW